MAVLTEGRHAAEFVMSEANGNRSRGNVVIADGETVVPGTVLGKVGVNEGTVTVGTPDGTGNTGDGTCTKESTEFNAGVQEGTYTIELVEVVTDGGVFSVRKPDGTMGDQATVGVVYDGDVRFTIADGATDFAVGDKFTIAVTIAAAADEGQYKALNLSATDGAESAVAVAMYAAAPSGATETVAGIVRDAVVNQNLLTWPAGITGPQKTSAIAELKAQGIIVRS